MKRHAKLWITLATIAVMILACFGWWNSRGHILNGLKVQHDQTATLFIPGFGGNQLSINGMMTDLEAHHLAKKTMIVHVSHTGAVKVTHLAKDAHNNPLIAVLFADNKQPYRQAQQLVHVTEYLKAHEHINSINLLGHSSGGFIAYQYLTQTSHNTKVPTPKHFVSLASAYYNQPKVASRLPRHLHILSVAGAIGHTENDGAMALKTITPMKQLVSPYVASYKFVEVRGSFLSAEHSMLHENPRVDKIIAQFLFD